VPGFTTKENGSGGGLDIAERVVAAHQAGSRSIPRRAAADDQRSRCRTDKTGLQQLAAGDLASAACRDSARSSESPIRPVRRLLAVRFPLARRAVVQL